MQKVELIRKIAPRYFKGKLLDLGCGKMPYKNLIQECSFIDCYLGVDIENDAYQNSGVKPDIIWDGKTIPVSPDSVDTVLLVEVLEHVPDPLQILKEVFRILQKGGNVFITVPFIWNLHDVPYDQYRYTPFALNRLLMEAGFSKIHIESFGNWHASLAQVLSCWVRRSWMSGPSRKILSWILLPVIKYLYKKDKLIYAGCQNKFLEGFMCTGFSVIAGK